MESWTPLEVPYRLPPLLNPVGKGRVIAAAGRRLLLAPLWQQPIVRNAEVSAPALKVESEVSKDHTSFAQPPGVVHAQLQRHRRRVARHTLHLHLRLTVMSGKLPTWPPIGGHRTTTNARCARCYRSCARASTSLRPPKYGASEKH